MKVNEEGATRSDNFAVVGRLYAYRSPDSDAIASQIVREQWKSRRHEHLRNVTLSDVGSPGHVNPPFPTQAFTARTLTNPKFAQAERESLLKNICHSFWRSLSCNHAAIYNVARAFLMVGERDGSEVA